MTPTFPSRTLHAHASSQTQGARLTQRHLSSEKARWWMQVGGLYACTHFCAHLSMRRTGLSSDREGGRERAREREHENTGYTGILKSSLQTVYFFFLPFLPCVLPYLEHIPVEILCGDAIGSVRFPFYSQLCSYQSRWLTVGRRRGTYQCNHRERRAPVHRQHTKHIRAPE